MNNRSPGKNTSGCGPGKHVRLQISETIDKALSMAIVETNAEEEERALGTVDRGNNVSVRGER